MTEKIIAKTERLYLRELNEYDFNALREILQDQETMYAYEGAFSNDETRDWLDRQIARYQKWGYGLWAVILKENKKRSMRTYVTAVERI